MKGSAIKKQAKIKKKSKLEAKVKKISLKFDFGGSMLEAKKAMLEATEAILEGVRHDKSRKTIYHVSF